VNWAGRRCGVRQQLDSERFAIGVVVMSRHNPLSLRLEVRALQLVPLDQTVERSAVDAGSTGGFGQVAAGVPDDARQELLLKCRQQSIARIVVAAIAAGNIRGAHIALGKSGRVHIAWMGSDKAVPKASDGEAPMTALPE